MQRKTKAVLAGAGFLTLLGLGWRASRAKAAPPGGLSAGLSIAVYDPDGNIVPHNSPVTLQIGVTYTIRATVTNTSRQATAPYTPVGVSMYIFSSIDDWDPAADPPGWGSLGYSQWTASFGPGETLAFDRLYVASNSGNPSRISAYVDVRDAAGIAQIRVSAEEGITYAPAPPPPIQYGATLAVGAF